MLIGEVITQKITDMLELLHKVENSLVELLYKNSEKIKTMYIDYHKPFVSRIWFIDEELDCRVFLHKIEPCNDSKEALYHPHKWDSAMRIISGEYEMGIGHSETNETPRTDCKLILGAGTCYEMTEKDGWHYVFPKRDTYTLMVTPNKLNGREMPIEPKHDFRKLTRKEMEDILYTFREHGEKYNCYGLKNKTGNHIQFSVVTLLNVMGY